MMDPGPQSLTYFTLRAEIGAPDSAMGSDTLMIETIGSIRLARADGHWRFR